MSEIKTYPVLDSIASKTHATAQQYREMYKRSMDDPDGFWAEQADITLDWYKKWDTVSNYDFHTGEIAWFEGGQLNLSYNCIDRHLATRA